MRLDPRYVAFSVVGKIMQEGLKKHQRDVWREEPTSMHIQKASRHLLRTLLLLQHPDYNKDDETALQHLKNALCRASMAVTNLMEKDSPTES